MTRICTVCASPLRDKINSDLLDETVSLRRITAEYGIAKSTLHAHKTRCMGAPTVPDIAERTRRSNEKRQKLAAISRVAYLESKMPTREELGATLEDVVARLNRIVSKHETVGGTDVVALKGLAEMRSTVSELAKLAGHVGSGAQTNVQVGVQLNLSAQDIGSALAQHMTAINPLEALEMTSEVDE